MKRGYLVILYGLYVLAMGIVGPVRTDSVVPLLITGGIALATVFMGFWIVRSSRAALTVTTIWIAVQTLVSVYMTVGRIPAHDPSREGSEWIFGTLALFAAIVLVSLIGEFRRRHTSSRP